MIVVDSSVWIDYLRDVVSPTTKFLDEVFGRERVLIGDLMMVEVLPGIPGERAFQNARSLMLSVGNVITISDLDIATDAAANYRFLRSRGITIRKTIDTLIATRCIVDGYALLYSDRDFDPFVEHLGLKSAMA